MSSNLAHIIVFGNEKGGSGKSTVAIHVAIALLRLGFTVGTLDLDSRQGTLTGLLSHRWRYIKDHGTILPEPLHMLIDQSKADTREEQELEERMFMDMAISELQKTCDFVVVDTPGTYNHLSILAHGAADTLVTPVNDSMIDLSVLGKIDADTLEVKEASHYTKMVQDNRKDHMHWIVMRNRRSHLNMTHKRQINQALETMAREFDFTYVHGFGERVIFRELYLKGLTLMDVKDSAESNASLTMSQISARQEVRNLIAAINPSSYKGYKHLDEKVAG